MTTTKNRGLVVAKPPNAKGAVLTSQLPNVVYPLRSARRLRITSVHSLYNALSRCNVASIPPFRTPRRATSATSLINNNDNVTTPNTVAHTRHNVLFLSRTPRFDTQTLRALHRPLRSNCITLSHSGKDACCPTTFRLIVTTGPYPYKCCCNANRHYEYQRGSHVECFSHLSNPMLSQMSVRVAIPPIPHVAIRRRPLNRSDTAVHTHIVHTEGTTGSEFRRFK